MKNSDFFLNTYSLARAVLKGLKSSRAKSSWQKPNVTGARSRRDAIAATLRAAKSSVLRECLIMLVRG